jgi:hypothetical protein
MLTPLASADSLRIGSVDFVSPDEIKVLLDIEAPNDVALNTGVPRPFPRINSYALIPSDNGFLVAQIGSASTIITKEAKLDFGKWGGTICKSH